MVMVNFTMIEQGKIEQRDEPYGFEGGKVVLAYPKDFVIEKQNIL